MYNECNSLTTQHKITLDGLKCHQNESLSVSFLNSVAWLIEISKITLYFMHE